MIPGSNLLSMAFGLIGTQQLIWLKFAGRTQNALGQWINTYDAPVTITGSWQPVDASKYEALGLDMSKAHFQLYTPAPIQPVERATSPDLIEFAGRRYMIERDTNDWINMDGWRGAICIDIGAAQ